MAKKHQNGTVHQYSLDALGRQIEERIIEFGPGVDTQVTRVATTNELRGMLESITTCGSCTGSSSSSSSSHGQVLNQVLFQYDSTGKLVKEYQGHAGPVGLGDGLPTTPYVQSHCDRCAWAGLFTKGLRPTSVRYPNGRLVHYTYGPSSSAGPTLLACRR